MTKKIFLFSFLFLYKVVQAQVGIGTTNPLNGTSLQIEGENSGLLINRVSLLGTDDTTTIPGLGLTQEGLMVYNIVAAGSGNTSVSKGFYYWSGTDWNPVASSGNRQLGWVSLADGDYSNTLPFVNSPDLTNFANFENIDLDFTGVLDSTIDGFAPTGFTAGDFYDSTSFRFTPLTLGDAVMVRLQFDATPMQNNGVIVVQLDIGVNDIPGDGDDNVIYQKSIPLVRGGSRVTNVSETILLFHLSTFLANGAKLRMAYTRSNNNSGNTCDVDNFSIVVSRLSTNQ